MKKYVVLSIFVITFLLFLSCQKKEQIQVNAVNSNVKSISIEKSGDHDWLTEHTWGLPAGMMELPVVFREFEIPSMNILYQYRFRNARFSLMYQTERADKLYTVESEFSNDVFDVEFKNNFSILNLKPIGTGPASRSQNRVDERSNFEYPLVGIWREGGGLSRLTEYRLIDSIDCLYYMEIIESVIGRGIHGSAVRVGTYLLRQTEDNVFETISSFPDGCLRLEIKDKHLIILTPLFTLSENGEDGLYPLEIYNRIPLEILNTSHHENGFYYNISDDGEYVIITAYSRRSEDVHIPSRIQNLPVTTIGKSVFLDSQLTSVSIPNTVISIEEWAFFSSKLTSIVIPDSITSIKGSTFRDNKLSSITFPNNLSSIEDWAFCSNQLTTVTIPENVVSIGHYAFQDNQLTSVTLPESLTTIGFCAFSYNQLTSIIIPDSVTTIEYSAFVGNQLTSITIGADLTSIGARREETFNTEFDVFYRDNGYKAGTYTYSGGAWHLN